MIDISASLSGGGNWFYKYWCWYNQVACYLCYLVHTEPRRMILITVYWNLTPPPHPLTPAAPTTRPPLRLVLPELFLTRNERCWVMQTTFYSLYSSCGNTDRLKTCKWLNCNLGQYSAVPSRQARAVQLLTCTKSSGLQKNLPLKYWCIHDGNFFGQIYFEIMNHVKSLIAFNILHPSDLVNNFPHWNKYATRARQEVTI